MEGVTKIGRLKVMAPEARQAESVRKMVLAMVHDVRVVLVKLADRLHNMRTLEYLPSAKQQRISRETLDIYAPIAHRLGMSVMRGELEDLSFRYLEPESFLALQKQVADKAPFHQRFLEEVQSTIRTKLVESSIPAQLEARVKGLYSLHRKIVRQERSLEQIYDLLAVRVITDSERNCYAALGVMHHLWRPVPGRFKDYIAMPRPNLYQSLHTSVIHNSQPFEVQIRTQEMHHTAEEGVAAHWKYKDDRPASEDEQRITWMRQLIEWSQELQEPGEFLSTLKVDLAPGEVYAFTPKGPGPGVATRRESRGFRLSGAHRSRASVRGRESEWADGFAAARNHERRRRRDPDAKRPQAQSRVAQLCKVFTRAQQDSSLD